MDNTVAVAIIGGIFMLIGGFFGGKISEGNATERARNAGGILSFPCLAEQIGLARLRAASGI